MSPSQKRKAKPKGPRKAKIHPARKRVVPARKPAEKIVEAPAVRKIIPAKKAFLIAIRLKGSFGTPAPIHRTLESLSLNRKFNAVLLEKNPNAVATLRQAKDYVTWGDVRSVDIEALLKERGELFGGLTLTDKSVQERFGEQSVGGLALAVAEGRIALQTLWQKGLKRVFRLRPPSGGFESSTKRPYGSSGELGDRGPEISNLVAKMI